MKVRVQSHRISKGHPTFTINLPVQCECGHHFTQRVQVGVNNPIITCPVCYRRSYLKITWHLSKNMLTDGDIVEVIINK